MHQRGVANRQRNRPLADAAGLDWQDDKEQPLKRLQPQGGTDADADHHADDFAAQHREENPQKALNQRGAVHAHNAADDNAADIKVKNVGRLIEFGGRLHHHLRQQAVMHQRRRDEGRADGRRAELAEYRQAFTEFAAGKAEKGQRRHHHDDIARQLAAQAVQRDQAAGQQKERQRDNTDFPVIEDMPPALLKRGFRRINRVDGCRECIVCGAHN